MLNQTLTKQTYSKVIALRNERKPTYNALLELLIAQRDAELAILKDSVELTAIYRSQGGIAALEELINLFEKPEIFKDKLNE
jgi:hypothetical protein